MRRFTHYIASLRNKKSLIFLVLITACLNVNAQQDDDLPKVVPTIDGEIYQKIVEQMFSLDATDNEFTLVLRYSPTFESSRQIVFTARDEKIFVTEYVSNGDIEFKANEYLQRTGSSDASKIVQSIGVAKREFNISAKLEESWREKLIESVAKALKSQQLLIKPKDGEPRTANILLHGTTYEMWYVARGARLYFSEYGSKLFSPVYFDDSPFVRQMKIIQRQITMRK